MERNQKDFLHGEVVDPVQSYQVFGMMLGYFPDVEFIRYAKALIKQVGGEYALDHIKLYEIVQKRSNFNPFFFRCAGSVVSAVDVVTKIKWGLFGITANQAKHSGFSSKFVTILLEPELNVVYSCHYIQKLEESGIQDPYAHFMSQ